MSILRAVKTRLVLLLAVFCLLGISVSPVDAATSWDYLNYTEDFVDQTSNLHLATPDLGTHSVFADLQDYGANYDAMQEEDTGGGGGSITIENSYTSVGKRGSDHTMASVIVPTSTGRAIYWFGTFVTKNSEQGIGITSVVFQATGGDESFTLLGEQVNQQAVISIWYLLDPSQETADVYAVYDSNQLAWESFGIGVLVLSWVDTAGTPHDAWEIADEGEGTSATHTITSQSGDLVYDLITIDGASTLTESGDATGQWFDLSGSGNGRGASAYLTSTGNAAMAWTIGATEPWVHGGVSINPSGGGGSNYELDIEVGWTAVDFDETSEELCIYPVTGGGWPAEDILVDIWTGSWTNLFADLTPDTWNNISISSYLTDATPEIRFLGGTETSDTTQDTWEIDAVLIQTWSYAYTMNLYDAIGVADSETVSANYARTYYDAIGVADSETVSAGFVEFLYDAIGLADSETVSKSLVRKFYDAIGVAESVVVSANIVVKLFEAIGLAVALSKSKILTKSFSDAIGMTDIDTISKALSRTFYDAIGTAESEQLVKVLSRVFYDAFGVADSETIAAILSRRFYESFGLADSITVNYIPGGVDYQRYLYDVIGVADVETVSKALSRRFSDAIGVAEIEQLVKTLSRAFSDTFGLSSTAYPAAQLSRKFYDAIGMSEKEYIQLVIQRYLYDAFGLSDSETVSAALSRTYYDAFGLADVEQLVKTLSRAFSDTFGIADTDTISAAIVVTFFDAFGLADSVSATLIPGGTQYQRYLYDVIGASDSVSKTRTANRSFSDTFGLSEWWTHVGGIPHTPGGIPVWSPTAGPPPGFDWILPDDEFPFIRWYHVLAAALFVTAYKIKQNKEAEAIGIIAYMKSLVHRFVKWFKRVIGTSGRTFKETYR